MLNIHQQPKNANKLQETNKTKSYNKMLFFSCLIVIVAAPNIVNPTHFNVALLVREGNDIDSTALQNSLAWTQKHILRGYGVVINILKVNIQDFSLINDKTELNENITKSSFLLEPYYTSEHTCLISDISNIPLVSIADAHMRSCRNIITMQPSYKNIVNVLSHFLAEEGILTIAIVMEKESSDLATEIMSNSDNSVKIYFILLKSVDMTDRDDIENAFKKIKDENHMSILLVMRSYSIEKFVKMFRKLNPSYDVDWFVPLISVRTNNDLSALSNMAGIAIPINYLKLIQVRKELDRMKTSEERTFPGYLNINPLIHDAIVTIAETIKLFPNDLNRAQSKSMFMLESLKWKTYLAEKMKDISFEGITGKVEFTKHGYRNITNVDIGEVNKNGEYKVIGTWLNECQIVKRVEDMYYRHKHKQKQCHTGTKKNPSNRMRKKHLKIATIPEKPFIDFNESLGRGNDRFRGFCKDLLDRLSKELEFTYELYISPGNPPSYGTCEVLDGKNACEWNGLIGEIVTKKADAAVGSITITSERENIVDFSKPFMDFTMTLIMEKSTEKEFDIFAFLRPFEPSVWLSIAGVTIAVTLILFYIDKHSPNGCCHLAKKESADLTGEEFSFPNCMWFATASLLQQGPDYTPKCAAARILSATFWFFTLIIISTYTANLAAFFTTSQSALGIKSLEDLAKQDKMEYGILGTGQTYSLFMHSTIPLYKQMYNFMRLRNGFVKSSSEGVARVRKGGYAYLSEDPIIYYKHQRQPCNTAVLRNLLEAKSYGIVLQKQSEWTNLISVMILDLREKGFIEELRRKWWDEASECSINEKTKKGQPISLKITSLGGVYIIMIVGIFTALLFLVVEIRYKNILGGRCLPQEYTFHGKNSRSLKHEIRYVDPSEPEDKVMQKIQRQMNNSNEYLNNRLNNIYSPKESPPPHYKFNAPRDLRNVQESTL